MTDQLRAAAEAALEAIEELEYRSENITASARVKAENSKRKLRAALADAEDEAWELDYEVRVDTGEEEMWVAGASTGQEALHYAAQYVEEGTVRVYERRMKVVATLKAKHD